jgi:hypothetical protein
VTILGCNQATCGASLFMLQVYLPCDTMRLCRFHAAYQSSGRLSFVSFDSA